MINLTPFKRKFGFSADATMDDINGALRNLSGYEMIQCYILLNPLCAPNEFDQLVAWETRTRGKYRGSVVLVANSPEDMMMLASFGTDISVLVYQELVLE